VKPLIERYNAPDAVDPGEAITMSRKKPQATPDTAKNGARERPMSREDFLEFALSVVKAKEKLTLAAEQNLRANFGLQYDYPDQYVVFRDHWEGTGRKRRLVREVLAHGTREDLKKLSDLVVTLPFGEENGVSFDFIRDPFREEIEI
jgi:hypothetical protein